MSYLLKLEEALMFGLGIFLFGGLGYEWWWFPLLLLLPDIGMLGYLFGNMAGAVGYNLFHHKGLAIALFFLGSVLSVPLCQLCGTILFSHASLDRMLGYGLKYGKGFKYTHLGEIGKEHGK